MPTPANAVRDGDGRIRIDLADAQGTVVERATFDSDGRLHAFEVLDDSGDVSWSAQFGEYRDVGGSPFAHSIEIYVRSGQTRAEISFRNVEMNPDLPPGLFRLFSPREGSSAGAGADGR
jgi:outer membrane lipoprotein-sorting protein